jgi:hypothetical protein
VYFFFAVIGVPHRNNAAGFAAWRPDQNHRPKIKQTDGDVFCFAIISAEIFNGDDHGLFENGATLALFACIVI